MVISNTKKIRAELSVEDRNMILEHVSLFHPGLEEKLRKKRSRSGYVTIDLDKDELSDLLGCIAREANHTSKRWLEDALNPIFEYLESLEYEMRMLKR